LGECPGMISMEKRGTQGFGYDPIFLPDGSEKTFGEMAAEEKNLFSHRGKALEKLVLVLQEKK
ncbi:MAG: non-canonical purine NTP pyrophosphatase, partial [Candidatus Thermoplasmatota archaeon]|nr:non-canonical purine NTP pyrophosphatase [Candidatus Thermoplasmatota archaeon]